MNLQKLVIYTVLSIGLITLTKVLFATALDINNIYIVYVMWLLVAVWAIAFTRRLGVLNYLESIMVLIVWVVTSLILDYIILGTLLGNDVYRHLYLWISYLIIVIAVFLFHKKRHVEIRNR